MTAGNIGIMSHHISKITDKSINIIAAHSKLLLTMKYRRLILSILPVCLTFFVSTYQIGPVLGMRKE
jgi:hypothetical protein